MAGRHGGLESSKIKKSVHQHEKHDLELFWNPKTRIPRGKNRKEGNQEGKQEATNQEGKKLLEQRRKEITGRTQEPWKSCGREAGSKLQESSSF